MSVQNVAAGQRRLPRNAMMVATRIFNPLAMLLAGTRLLPLYGVIHHVGRRSGKQFRTPVVVRPISGGFIVPMPWGEKTDWFRNVSAAGGCIVRWKGRRYEMVDPQVIPAEEALGAFSGPTRVGMSRFGIRQVMRLRFR
jgi:deazaflavin-dependent oxidoreductase (nitroreductase family)